MLNQHLLEDQCLIIYLHYLRQGIKETKTFFNQQHLLIFLKYPLKSQQCHLQEEEALLINIKNNSRKKNQQ